SIHDSVATSADQNATFLLDRSVVAARDQDFDELVRLGDRHRLEGNAAKAEPLLREALAIAEDDSPPERRKLTEALNTLGILCKDLAKYDEAFTLYSRALWLAEHAESVDKREVATPYHNLGGHEH